MFVEGALSGWLKGKRGGKPALGPQKAQNGWGMEEHRPIQDFYLAVPQICGLPGRCPLGLFGLVLDFGPLNLSAPHAARMRGSSADVGHPSSRPEKYALQMSTACYPEGKGICLLEGAILFIFVFGGGCHFVSFCLWVVVVGVFKGNPKRTTTILKRPPTQKRLAEGIFFCGISRTPWPTAWPRPRPCWWRIPSTPRCPGERWGGRGAGRGGRGRRREGCWDTWQQNPGEMKVGKGESERIGRSLFLFVSLHGFGSTI